MGRPIRFNKQTKNVLVKREEEQSNKEIYVFAVYSYPQMRNLIIWYLQPFFYSYQGLCHWYHVDMQPVTVSSTRVFKKGNNIRRTIIFDTRKKRKPGNSI